MKFPHPPALMEAMSTAGLPHGEYFSYFAAMVGKKRYTTDARLRGSWDSKPGRPSPKAFAKWIAGSRPAATRPAEASRPGGAGAHFLGKTYSPPGSRCRSALTVSPSMTNSKVRSENTLTWNWRPL